LSRDDFYTPTDIDALRMENELLTFEVRFLKAQLSARETEAERFAAQLKSQLEESGRRLEESERSAEQLRGQLAEAQRAKQDLVLLLTRLSGSPLGWIFRLRENFRILEQRYLDTDA
jgi:uncharacterized protein HemX